MPIEFLDPRPPVRVAGSPGVPRGASSTSIARVGMLANGFPDSEAFVDALAASLCELRPGLAFATVTKARPPDPLDDRQLDVLTGCDAVLAAYGH